MNDSGNDSRITPAYPPGQVPKRAPCQEGCLNCGDIRGWIALVAQRRKLGLSRRESFAEAWRKISEVNPFPATLGRICPHPCENACNRGALDEPLAINAMERFLGDFAIEADLPLPRSENTAANARLAVVGSGPSGLSFAYQMARRGHSVSVFEAREEPGGMLRYGVPEYRLPRGVLDAEIDRILDLGVELHLSARIGGEKGLERLRRDYDGVYLGIGAQKGRRLDLPGADGDGVVTATEYLGKLARGEHMDLGSRVVVVGGGNSAMDAARSARRGGSDVTVLYRRSLDDMPASQSEIEEAAEEGVDIVLLAAPAEFVRSASGRLEAIRAVRMGQGERDESGRPRPVALKGKDFQVPADTVVLALSQVPVLDGLDGTGSEGPWLDVDGQGSLAERLYAGGDAVSLGMAGSAIVQGRRVAEQLHARFEGADAAAPHPGARVTGSDEILTEGVPKGAASRAARLDPDERLESPTREVSQTISEDDFLREVERCFSCGQCFGCERCHMYCTAGCFTRLEESQPGAYYALDTTACMTCGKCVEVCPCGYLEVV